MDIKNKFEKMSNKYLKISIIFAFWVFLYYELELLYIYGLHFVRLTFLMPTHSTLYTLVPHTLYYILIYSSAL